MRRKDGQPQRYRYRSWDHLVGTTISFWIVLSVRNGAALSEMTFTCQCACGKVEEVIAKQLLGKKKKSCGCKTRELILANCLKHGGTKSNPREYACWGEMRKRCLNNKSKRFKDYGARGITICERWSDFALFLSDMGPCPSPDHSLDRYPDNNGDYEPGNCRWATNEQQCNNKRNNVLLSHNGVTLTAHQWSKVLHVNAKLICQRRKLGWADERILTTPAAKCVRIPRPRKKESSDAVT